MAGRLVGKVALVTGGGSGIGRASALAFAREGAKVVVADVNAQGGDQTVQMLKSTGSEAIFIRTDVTKLAEVESMVSRAIEAYGRLDCAFNNAGVESSQRSTVDCAEQDFDRIININLKGVWLCMKYEIPPMLRQGRGAIVNTASTLGLVGAPRRPEYVASKHGVVGLTKVAALECAALGIRVNAVCPGMIDTPLVERIMIREPEAKERGLAMPMGRLGTPEEIAEAVVWLCSDAASFMTGHTMAIDGGWVAR